MSMLRIILALTLTLSLNQPGLTAGMKMRGTLVVISCSINNDKPLEISFGEAVGVKKVDGVRYKQPLPVDIKCSRAPGDLLNLVFKGTAASFESTALATQNSDLGIRLLKEDQPVEVNKPLILDENAIPKFYAVPVKRADSLLVGGQFNALATLAIILE